jgi:hypothetical protein
MEIQVPIGRGAFEGALQAARHVAKVSAPEGLAAPLDGALKGRVAEVWDSIELALRTAYERGRDHAQSLINAAIARVEKLMDEAGARARDIQAFLLERLHAYVTAFTRGALANVTTILDVGDQRLSLSRIQLSQKLVLGGSLKASLADIFALTSSGEITIQVDYGMPVAPVMPEHA